MPTYTFQEHTGILNSTILDDSLQPCFITKTTWRFPGRRSTTVTDLSGTLFATIHWKDKAFEINGTTISTKLIKSKKPQPIFSANWQRCWQWGAGGPQYSIEYGKGQWTATDCSTGSTHIIFTCYKIRFFKESKPATLTVQDALPQTEGLFLLLAMLRMETRRLDAEESFRNHHHGG